MQPRTSECSAKSARLTNSLYHFEEILAKEYIKTLLAKKAFKEITTTLEPFTIFYPAEAYHQDFEKRNPDYPYVKQVSIPRLKAFKIKTKDLLKKNHE